MVTFVTAPNVPRDKESQVLLVFHQTVKALGTEFLWLDVLRHLRRVY